MLILAFLQHAIAHAYIVFVCYDAGERTGAILNHVVIAACSSFVGVMTNLCPQAGLVAASDDQAVSSGWSGDCQ